MVDLNKLPKFDEKQVHAQIHGPSKRRFEQNHIQYDAQKRAVGVTSGYVPPAKPTGGVVTLADEVVPPYDRFHASTLNGEIKTRRGNGMPRGAKKPDMIEILEAMDAEVGDANAE